MDKFSYAIGLGIGQNLLSMGAKGIAVDDFAQAIKDVLEGNQTAISHQEAREIVNKYFEELEAKMGEVAIEQGKAFLEENKKRAGVVTLPSGLQYEVINKGTGKKAKAKQALKCIKGLENRKYRPRKYEKLFENCILRDKDPSKAELPP